MCFVSFLGEFILSTLLFELLKGSYTISFVLGYLDFFKINVWEVVLSFYDTNSIIRYVYIFAFIEFKVDLMLLPCKSTHHTVQRKCLPLLTFTGAAVSHCGPSKGQVKTFII